LPPFWMYTFFVVMGLMGVGVLIGYKYRWSMGIFTIMWTYLHLMHKTGYNNHYYLLILLCIFMWIAPARHYLSADAKQNPALRRSLLSPWIPCFIILQMRIVYVFATTAKI